MTSDKPSPPDQTPTKNTPNTVVITRPLVIAGIVAIVIGLGTGIFMSTLTFVK